VQNLSSEGYATWAAWQNRQAELRAAEEAENSDEEPYVYSVRTTSSVSGGITAALNRTSRHTAINNVATWHRAVTETSPRRYINPAYRPPGSVTIHNPYARFANNVGTPNWDKIFVPCESGTMTVSEAMGKLGSPVPAELLFSEVMLEWLK
jgi:hypothetical protein